MKIHDVLDKSTKTVDQLAKKYNVTAEYINQQLRRGTEVESEHTSHSKVAREIALDHLGERLDYYTQLTTVEQQPSVNNFIKKFAPWVAEQLGIKLPKIELLDKPIDTTFGQYNPETKSIKLVTGGRHPIDVLRTLAHELTHYKQDLEDNLPAGAGETGTDQENEANANAGITMRDFAQQNPDQFGLDKDLAEGTDYFAGSKFMDEEGNTFSVEKILAFAKKNPKYFHKDFPLLKIQHDLAWWQNNKERMMNADTRYPLLVIQNDDGHLSVADGLNRMKKAVDIEKKKTINVYIVPKKDIMKFSEKKESP